MNETQLALMVSAIAVTVPAVNTWLTLRVQATLEEFAEKIERKYVPRETFEAEIRRIDERCAQQQCHHRAA